MNIIEYSKNHILVLDGAMGTMLQKNGLKTGENPEILNITHSDIVSSVHRQYIEAGAKMILCNTFGANAKKLQGTAYSVDEIIKSAVTNAKNAIEESGKHAYIALDIGPIGELLCPNGTLSFDGAYLLFKEQVEAGVKYGVDVFHIETMTDLLEVKAALLAVRENASLPCFCTLSFEQNMHTFLGTSIPSMAVTLEGLGADMIGINCSLGPREIKEMTKELLKWTNLPVIVKPNAGLPSIVDGETVFNLSLQEFETEMKEILDLGVSAVGGCCGTTPKLIQILAALSGNRIPVKREKLTFSAVSSAYETVLIDRVRIIGERINPTGKKAFQKALLERDMDYILKQAIEQVSAGADILDVNVGYLNIDEKEMMTTVLQSLQSVIKTPLQIDSSNAGAIEAGLRIYNGKPIVNSVNGEEHMLHKILPLIKKYGAAVVGLTLDEKGIPKTAEERLAVAEKIVSTAQGYGISKKDIFIDCLTLTAGAEQENAYETVKALSLIKNKLGVKTVLGVSNISFGLPAREKINQVFLALCLANGLDLPIINPNVKAMVDTVYCYHQLKNIDKNSNEYVNRFSKELKETEKTKPQNETFKDISYCVRNGLKEDIRAVTASLMMEMKPLEIIDRYLIPTLDSIGKDYESGKIFLPNLLKSAEAAKSAFEVIKKKVPKNEAKKPQKIILATVKGDVHDIGKNIVKVVLENYGYTVIDLGKDVDMDVILKEAIEREVKLIGLSALMTTTVANMEKTISHIKKSGRDIKIMVGGAVLTPEYARSIGADYYAKDAMGAVRIAKEVLL